MSTSPDLFSNAINLNRFSNSVAKRIARTYNDLILDSVDQLRGIDELAAPVKAARLRSILAQLKGSLDGWAGSSTLFATEELQGLAELETDFAVGQLKKELPAQFADEIASVQIDPQFAKSVATVDPTALNVVSLSDDLQAAVSGSPQTFRLTAAQGSTITLPNGKVIEKSFRGLAESQADLFSMKVRNGLLTGEPIDRIAKDLKGRLRFGQPAMSLRQMQQAGGQLTSMANHQVSTIVRTSVNQVANASSQQVYKANQDVTKKYEYLATLDGRTSPICRSLDGQTFVYGQGPTPPQHFNCRSTTKPIVDYKGLGIEPPPEDTRASASGPVPEGMTYGEWLKAQPLKTKQEVLGASKVKYFEKLSERVGPTKAIRMFVSRDGSELTLAQLKAKTDRMKPKVTPKAAAQAKEKAEQAAKAKAAAAVKAKQAAAAKAKAEAQQKAAQAKAAAEAKSIASKQAAVKAQASKKAASESSLNKRGRTADTNYDYDKNWEKLGYDKKTQYRKAKEDIVEWSGNEFEGVRAAQFADARDRGVELNDYERLQTRRLEKGEQRTAGNRARRLEDFIDRAPKYDGTIRRGVALDTREDVLNTIERYNSGKRNLAIESWTTDSSVSNRFAMGNGDPRPQRMSVLVEGNTKGAPINSISGFDDEFEVLVPSGVRYEVVDVKETFVKGNPKGGPTMKTDHTDWVVTLREIKD